MKPPVLIIFGPTASGKTEIIKKLFAEENPVRAEIISADSMQVYRGMDIGTAKPPPEERKKIPHHIIDIRNPDEKFNAGEFVRLAEEVCFAAARRGALPVVSGGTGFYLKNLVLGLSQAPPSDICVHNRLREELAAKGAASLMEELEKADPVSAGKIHINDVYRLIRALEVFRISGKPLSSYSSPWSFAPENTDRPFRFLLIGLRRKREELYCRINERTAAMFRAGLGGEVKRLFDAGYTPLNPGLRAIGYREFFAENEDGKTWRLLDDLAGIEALVARNSRRYAKRQITFFSALKDVKWIDCGDGSNAVREIRRELESFLK